MYKIKYYAKNNKSPVIEFIKEQPAKAKAKILREIDIALNRLDSIKWGETSGTGNTVLYEVSPLLYLTLQVF